MARKKIKIKDYNFIDLSETDLSDFSDTEIGIMAESTLEVLNSTRKKLLKTPMNLSLAAGYLAVYGGEFIKVTPLFVKWKKGNCPKPALKIIKRAFRTAKSYYGLKLFINLIKAFTNSDVDGMDWLSPTLAVRKDI